jgi:hypothetical protein
MTLVDCTMPLSHSTPCSRYETFTVRASSSGLTALRIRIRADGATDPSALMISTWREAWPKPWPEM